MSRFPQRCAVRKRMSSRTVCSLWSARSEAGNRVARDRGGRGTDEEYPDKAEHHPGCRDEEFQRNRQKKWLHVRPLKDSRFGFYTELSSEGSPSVLIQMPRVSDNES